MNASLLASANRLPPLLCVLCAREKRRPVPMSVIAKRAGMSIQRAVWIYGQEWWDTVPISEVDRFMGACGVDQRNLRHHLRYLRTTIRADIPLAHVELLRRSTAKRMAERLQELLTKMNQ